MTYAEFIADQAKLESTLRDIGAQLDAYPKGAMNLTIESAKDARYHQLKRAQAAVWKGLQDLNACYCKKFAKEIRADRDTRRAAALASRAA